jgi:hypothetical protein
VVGEHEDRGVIHRIVAPPPAPAVVGPRSSSRSEHVSAHDPRADVVESPDDKVVVYSGRSSLSAEHVLKRPGGESPFVQGFATRTKGIFEVLIGASAVAIDGYRKAMDTKFGHKNSFGRLQQEHLTGQTDPSLYDDERAIAVPTYLEKLLA